MATPSPTPTGHLAYSDYMQGAAIVTGTVAGSTFVLGVHPEIVGWLGIATTVLLALAQWLYSKGD